MISNSSVVLLVIGNVYIPSDLVTSLETHVAFAFQQPDIFDRKPARR